MSESGLEIKLCSIGLKHFSTLKKKGYRFGGGRRLKALKRANSLKSGKNKSFFIVGSGYPASEDEFVGDCMLVNLCAGQKEC